MSDYTVTFDGATKDGLSTGDPNKVVKGVDMDTEFDNIATSIGTKANKKVPAATNNVAQLSASGDLVDSTVTSTELAILDGATVTTAELNVLDGATVTTAELNKLDVSGNQDTSWTPVLDVNVSTGTFAYTVHAASCWYVRIGNLVLLNAYIYNINIGTGSGDLTMTGLPYAPVTGQVMPIFYTGMGATATDDENQNWAFDPSGIFYKYPTGAGLRTIVNDADVKNNNGTIRINTVYYTEAAF